jgi:hypothetical protein
VALRSARPPGQDKVGCRSPCYLAHAEASPCDHHAMQTPCDHPCLPHALPVARHDMPLHPPPPTPNPSPLAGPQPRRRIMDAAREEVVRLVHTLCAGHAAQRVALAKVAALCSHENPVMLVVIAAAGAVPPLVQLLGTASPPGVQATAAGALMSLAVNPDIAGSIAAAGGIAQLVNLLQPGTPARSMQ